MHLQDLLFLNTAQIIINYLFYVYNIYFPQGNNILSTYILFLQYMCLFFFLTEATLVQIRIMYIIQIRLSTYVRVSVHASLEHILYVYIQSDVCSLCYILMLLI